MVDFVPASKDVTGLYENPRPSLGGGMVHHTATAVARDHKLTRSPLVYHNSMLWKTLYKEMKVGSLPLNNG